MDDESESEKVQIQVEHLLKKMFIEISVKFLINYTVHFFKTLIPIIDFSPGVRKETVSVQHLRKVCKSKGGLTKQQRSKHVEQLGLNLTKMSCE